MFILSNLVLRLEPDICEGKVVIWVKMTRLCLIYSSPVSSFSFLMFSIRYGTCPYDFEQ